MTNFNIINLTPHVINIISNNVNITLDSSGNARCSATSVITDTVNGIDIVDNTYGAVTVDGADFPAPIDGTVFVVSFITAKALAAIGRRDDILFVANTVKNADGVITHATALARV